MPKKILVVEDEPALAETLSYNLEKEGYQVLAEGDGLEALKLARLENPDLIIMDIMLPGIDGLEITRTLRQEMNVPILMLTARDDEIDRVIGLEMGADDYLTKPFSMRELLARVKAQLRRERLIRQEMNATGKGGDERLVCENLEINLTRREALVDNQVIVLKPKEFELLQFLANHRGQLLSRDTILEKVWGWDFSGGSRTVDVHIRWLREKIELDPSKPNRIITVRGMGYRFEG
jgi:DNA-binding response OmpR family regulator